MSLLCFDFPRMYRITFYSQTRFAVNRRAAVRFTAHRGEMYFFFQRKRKSTKKNTAINCTLSAIGVAAVSQASTGRHIAEVG